MNRISGEFALSSAQHFTCGDLRLGEPLFESRPTDRGCLHQQTADVVPLALRAQQRVSRAHGHTRPSGRAV